MLGRSWIPPAWKGSQSVGMMKSSSCPHSSSPLHILIITNLQTYSKGHTHSETNLPSPALSPGWHHSLRSAPQLKFSCGGWIPMLVCRCLWHSKSTESFQRMVRCQLVLAGCSNPNLAEDLRLDRSQQGCQRFPGYNLNILAHGDELQTKQTVWFL